MLCLVGLLVGSASVLGGGDAAYQFALAKMHAAEGEYPEAIQAFKAAIEIEPSDPYIRLEFAEFLSRTGRSRQAADEAEKALALDADNLDSLRSVGQIRLELASRDPRSLDIAKSTLRTAAGARARRHPVDADAGAPLSQRERAGQGGRGPRAGERVQPEPSGHPSHVGRGAGALGQGGARQGASAADPLARPQLPRGKTRAGAHSRRRRRSRRRDRAAARGAQGRGARPRHRVPAGVGALSPRRRGTRHAVGRARGPDRGQRAGRLHPARRSRRICARSTCAR